VEGCQLRVSAERTAAHADGLKFLCKQFREAFVAFIFCRDDLQAQSASVGPEDEGGYYLFARLLSQSAIRRRVVLPATLPGTNTRAIGASSLYRLFGAFLKLVREGELKCSALLIVQTTPGSTDVNERETIDRAASLFSRIDVPLVALAVGDSCELADSCSTVFSRYEAPSKRCVLCWMNELTSPRQADVAFKLSYKVIELFLSQAPASVSESRAFLTALDDFSRKLTNGSSFAYKFGMEADGEPCFFPDFPARPYVEWTMEMYETKLKNAARQCATHLAGILKEFETTGGARLRSSFWRNEFVFRLGNFFGWMVLVRFSPIHNTLSRKPVLYSLEWSFSADESSLPPFKKLAADYKEQGRDGILDFIDGAIVGRDKFQFLKNEMLGMGETVLTTNHSCVISRAYFLHFLRSDDDASRALRSEFRKLENDVEVIASLNKESKDFLAYQQRLIWLHNNFRAMYQELSSKPTAVYKESFTKPLALHQEPEPNSSQPVPDYRLTVFIQIVLPWFVAGILLGVVLNK